MKTTIFLACLLLTSNSFAQNSSAQVIRTTELELIQSSTAFAPLSAAGQMPPYKNFSDLFPNDGDQCRSSSCVSFACVYNLLSYLLARDRHTGFDFNGPQARTKIFSPYFSFFYKKDSPDCFNCSSSTSKTLQFLIDHGAPTLKTFDEDPCNPQDCERKPDSSAIAEAQKNVLSNYAWIYSDQFSNEIEPSNLVKRFINASIPVVAIIDVPRDFRDLMKLDSNYIYKAETKKQENWHAMICAGFDLKRNALKFVNSYSKNWGYQGTIWIDCNYVNGHIGEAFVANVDDDLLVEGSIKFKNTKSKDTLLTSQKTFFSFNDNKFKIINDFFLSAYSISKNKSQIRIIQKGDDSLYYISSMVIKNSNPIDIKLSLKNEKVTLEANLVNDLYFDKALQIKVKQ